MSGKSVCGERVPGRGAEKKAFEKARQDLADKFLKELDAVITNGRLAELTAPTGGIRIFWSNKLNKTAGRAHWKCERVRSAVPGEDKVIHHASIELAEKIIDDEHRLLNTLAHEFCHLANYMISGITSNPHGQEFKAWGEKCSQAFGNRGVVVTTKHSYDIAFKFVWECVGCGIEYKRHSKSVDPARHRCSQCQSELKQTKPVPRRKKEDGSPAKQSEWQVFMKEQMPLIRAENPKMPLKDIMRIVAARWAERSKVPTLVPDESADEASEGWEDGKLVMLNRHLERVGLTEDGYLAP
jgi:predicted SprT family Zn-dependent metalloprotease